MDKEKKRQIFFLGLIVLFLLASLALLLWYAGFFSFSLSPYRDDATQQNTKQQKTIDLFSDPRFQQLHIQDPTPLDIGIVGNPNPFLPFEGRELTIPN